MTPMADGRFTRLETKSANAKPTGALPPPEGSIPRDAAATPAPVEGDEGYYSTFIEKADEAFFTGAYRDALRHYSRALQAENNHVYPWIGQISALIQLKQYKEAELWSTRALEQFPEESSLLSQRARVLALTGNARRAVGVSDYALSKGATSWTWLARGDVLLEAADNNALFCFEKAVELAGKEDWRTPLIAGLAFARKRQWSSAEDFLRRSKEINPKNFFVWFEYALVLTEMSYLDRASDALKRCLQLNPRYMPAKDLELRLFRRPFLKRLMGMMKR